MVTHRHSPGHNNLPPATTGSTPDAINHNQQPHTETPEAIAVRQALNNLPQLAESINQTVDQHMIAAREALRNEQMAGLETDIRNSGFNKTISKAEDKIHKKEQKLQKLEQSGRLSKKKKAYLEWDILKQKHEIHTTESFKQNTANIIKRKYGIERQKDPLLSALTNELQNVETEADRRQQLIDAAQNPNTESDLRIMMQEEIASWGGETVEDFVDRRSQEIRQNHQERLIKSTTAEKIQKFGRINKELSERIQIANEAQTSQDPAKRQELLLKMASWGESIADFKKRVIADDELDLFNTIAAINAERNFQDESQEVKKSVKKFEELLKKEQELRLKAKDIHAEIIDLHKRINAETDLEVRSDLLQKNADLTNEYNVVRASHSKIKLQLKGVTSSAEYEKRLMRPVAAKYLLNTQIVNL